jgi:protein LSM14
MILKVSQGAPAPQTYGAYTGQYPARTTLPSQVPTAAPEQAAGPASSSQPNRRREPNGRPAPAPTPNAVRSAAASLENVERAMGDLRVADAPRNGRRGNTSHGEEIQAGNINVPAADFDFASSNAKFDKAALAKPESDSDSSDSDSESGSEEVKTNPSDSEAEGKEKDRKEKEKAKGKEMAYNPSKSFFDSLTPNSLGNHKVGAQMHRGGGGRGRGRGYGRSRREEEAQRNLMTFGETTPPSYATSWGGRRGGPRRGGYVSQGVVPNGRPG